MKSRLRTLLIPHPLLFAAFPVISLYAANANELVLSDLTWTLLPVVGGALVLWVLTSLLLRNIHKGAVLTSLAAIWFFSYGHLEFLLTVAGPLRWLVRQPLVLVIVWGLVLLAAVIPVVRTRRRLHSLSTILNVAVLGMLALPLYNTASVEIQRTMRFHKPAAPHQSVPTQAARIDPARLPNIYYIIMDGYGRHDVLNDLYGFDNSAFLRHLTGQGFTILPRSHANYMQTFLSLASSLNMTYLDKVPRQVGINSRDVEMVRGMIKNSEVMRTLKANGYTTVAFASGFYSTSNLKVDVYIDEKACLTNFQGALLNSTVATCLLRRQRGSKFDQYETHRRTVRRVLTYLPRTANFTPPIFVFGHILSPHPPFIFDANGKAVQPPRDFRLADGSDYYEFGGTREEYRQGYTAQASYITREVQKMIDQLIARSKRPTVIILQSDHGPGLRLTWDAPEMDTYPERLAILNAIRLPKGDHIDFPPDATPINTFSRILDYYLGTKYPIQHEESYFSSCRRPYAFAQVTKYLK